MNHTPEKVASFILRHTPEAARQWPCFLGPTGAGKTARARAIAAELGLRMVTLLPATSLPEDILGLPVVKDEETLWTLTDWAKASREEPCLIFIDEADKARPETVGALLTLMSGLQVRDVALHPATRILVAMQPVDRAEFLSTETGRAFAARMVFVPVQYDRARIAAMFGLDAAALASAAGKEPPVELPTLPVISDRQLEAIFTFCAAADDPEMRHQVVYGIAGERVSSLLAVWETAAASAVITPAQVRDALVADKTIADTMTVPELVSYAPLMFVYGCPRSFRVVMQAVAMRGTPDDWSAAVRAIPVACRELLETAAAGEAPEIFRAVLHLPDDQVADQLYEELDSMLDELLEWQARQLEAAMDEAQATVAKGNKR